MREEVSAAERQLLRSWKEVAGFLSVTVRTAQRWERQRSLPVRRLGSERNARVVAYTDELLAWLESHRDATTLRLEPDVPAVGSWRARLARLTSTPVAIGAIIAVIVGIMTLVWWIRPGPPVQWQVENDLFKALDERGKVCWVKPISGLRPDRYTPDGRLSLPGSHPGDYDGILHQDVDGDGAKEWLINWLPRPFEEGRGRLICLEAGGEQRWEFAFGAPQRWRGRSLSSDYVGLFTHPISVGRKNYILTVANHAIWFPSQVALIDPKTGRILEEYWHPGGLFRCRIDDIDKDGLPELLLAGINNPGRGLGYAALVVLRLPISRAGLRRIEQSANFWELTGVKEFGYVLFPRPDTFDTAGHHPVPDTLTLEEGGRLLIRISRGGEGSVFYYLDSSLKLVESRITEGVVATHNRLHVTGEIDHAWSEAEEQALGRIQTFSAAPDGNSPQVACFWDFRQR